MSQDEYWTSQKCHTCKQFLQDGKGHRTKVCGNVACPDHDQATNRDLNAALNLKRVWDKWLAKRRRPGYLTPPEGDGDAAEEGPAPVAPPLRGKGKAKARVATLQAPAGRGGGGVKTKDATSAKAASAHPGPM